MIRYKLGLFWFFSGLLFDITVAEPPAMWLRSMVETYFSTQLQVEISDLQIKYVHIPHLVPQNQPQMKYTLESKLSFPRPGYQVLWLKIIEERTVYQRIPLVLDVTVTRDVVVAAHKLERGTILSEELVTTRRMKINNRSQFLFYDIKKVLGQMVTRSIPEGEIISKSMVKPRPAVRRGEKVTVQIINGNIMVSTKGTVHHDAQLGERVQITFEPTGKRVRGVVYSPQIIRVTL